MDEASNALIGDLKPVARAAIGFAAGAGAGLVLVAVMSLLQLSGGLAAVDLSTIDAANLPFLYRQVTWGGVWGLLLATGVLDDRTVVRGVALGTAATIALFVVFFPLRTANGVGPGFAGMNVGLQLPAFALVANAGWGVVAASLYKHFARADPRNMRVDRRSL